MKDQIDVRPIESLAPRLLRWAKKAARVRRRAYAPYSHFLVGSAVQDEKGKWHTGCNVENASFSAGICAERGAVAKLISRGGKSIRCVIVVGSSEEPIFPCGVCLQVLHEFGPEAHVIAANKRLSKYAEMELRKLYPVAFSRDDLK